jgi:hypothetical protein
MSKRSVCTIPIAIAAFVAFAAGGQAWAQDNIQIVSPPTGTIVVPGQTLEVTVTKSSLIDVVILEGDLLAGFGSVNTGPNPFSIPDHSCPRQDL